MIVDFISQRTSGPAPDDTARTDALNQTGLLDTPAEETFDRITRLACHSLEVPVALVSLVDTDRQFFKSAVGLPEPWDRRRETPLSHSFCKHVVASRAPLIVEDAVQHAMVCDNPAISDLGVKAYLGMPLATADGHVLGSLCVADGQPRTWSAEDVAVLRDLAAVAASEISLRRLAREFEVKAKAESDARKQSQTRVEQALRSEAFSNLAGGVAHDFANVLHALRSGVRIAANSLDRDPSAAKNALAMIDQVALRGSVVTNRLLHFARKREPAQASVNVDELFAKLGELLTLMLGSTVCVHMRTEPGLSVLVNDECELEMVLLNLANNARDAMPAGGTLTLEATATRVDADDPRMCTLPAGLYVRLSTSDTGTGMDAATLARASDSYFTTKPEGKGTGLGLSMAREFASQAGGGLVLTSELGRGTAVDLLLPAAEPQNHPSFAETPLNYTSEAA